MSHPYCISVFHIHHMDYLDPSFTKLKYSDALYRIIQRGQSHLNPRTDFTSTWLYPVAFCHCIKNAGSPAPKYSKLLASHYGDLRSERHLCPYTSQATLDSRVLHRWVTYSTMMYSYISHVCHTCISTLFDYKDNQPIWYTMIYTR